jgi:hypothetical protein
MRETKEGKMGPGQWLLITQALLVVVFYLALVVYPTSRDAGLSLILVTCIGMIYCGYRGITGFWSRKE